MSKLKGVRIYVTVLVAIALVGVQALGLVEVPESVWTALGFVGLGFMRASISSFADDVKKAAGIESKPPVAP